MGLLNEHMQAADSTMTAGLMPKMPDHQKTCAVSLEASEKGMR
jgi:mannose-6-phosphate isomerase class I